MSVESRFRMSQERLDELKKELEYLQTVREKEVSEQIKEARSFGDLSENSEYDRKRRRSRKCADRYRYFRRQPRDRPRGGRRGRGNV